MTGRATRAIRITTGVYATALAVASLLPSEGRLGGWDSSFSPDLQNALHVPCYTVLAVGVALSISAGAAATVGALLLAGAATAVFGVVLEAVQILIPGRTGCVDDVVLNLAGIAAAMPIAWWLTRRMRRGPSGVESERGQM